MSVFHSPPERDGEDRNGGEKTINGTLPIRAGAKRKLGAREDEGKADTKSHDDFTFSRKANVPSEEPVKSRETLVKDESKARLRKDAPTTTIQAMTERKALGESMLSFHTSVTEIATNIIRREHQYRPCSLAQKSF
jgi:hypothetical protein